MKYRLLSYHLLMLIFLFSCIYVKGQSVFNQSTGEQQKVRVAFYNLENFFDLREDSLINDEEFLPHGLKAWNEERFQQKLKNTFKIIAGLGGWEPPGILGLCELENGYILHEITQSTPLKKYDYQFIHFDSPDRRGIDVGLVYRSSLFKPLQKESLTINFPFDPSYVTRDILHVKGLVLNKDTLHIFINHWPSRWGGQVTSAPKRNYAAKFLRKHIDSLGQTNKDAKIVIMGDFNDEPHNHSLANNLQNKTLDKNKGNPIQLTNLMDAPEMEGTHKYQGKWQIFDQIIVSANLIKEQPGLKVAGKEAKVFQPEWLLKKDEKSLGMRPYRTYRGYIYEGGYSDHLPVYIDLYSDK